MSLLGEACPFATGRRGGAEIGACIASGRESCRRNARWLQACARQAWLALYIQGLPVDDITRERLNRSSVELLEEKQMAIAVVGPPR